MENYSRRLPVYLLLDTSESMAGPAIEAVTQGVNTLVQELRTNPLALDTAYLSVITFSCEAKQTVPLTELVQFRIPPLRIRPGTAQGAALRLLIDSLHRDVRKTAEGIKGDYKPLVFLLTDGQPTDNWEDVADTLKQAGLANVYAIGCGPDVDTEILYRVTDQVLLIPKLTAEAIRKFFVWLSASVQTVSTRADATTAGGLLNLPVPPLDVMETAQRSNAPRDNKPRQVFLHAFCSKSTKPYLMRFAKRAYEDLYDAVASHPLEALEEGDANALPQIKSSLLCGIPDCPYCENPSAVVCPTCSGIFCKAREQVNEVTCPKCGTYLVRDENRDGGDIDIVPSHG